MVARLTKEEMEAIVKSMDAKEQELMDQVVKETSVKFFLIGAGTGFAGGIATGYGIWGR
jgi:hypothetical protein